MSKRAHSGQPKKDQPIVAEPRPPLLSEELIAQLQNAVSAAQRKRTRDLNEFAETRDAERPKAGCRP